MTALLLLLPLWTASAADEVLDASLNEQVSRLSVEVKDLQGWSRMRDMIVTTFHPAGAGPFPIVVLSHGRSGEEELREKPLRFRMVRAAAYFVRRGFLVVVPTRIGYGDTGVLFDPESSGDCEQANYAVPLKAAVTEILAALDSAKALPIADPRRVVLVGQSVGGFATVGAAATNPAGLTAAINFSGGHGGNLDEHPGDPCNPRGLNQIFRALGTASKVPSLWLYTENDKLFAPRYTKRWGELFHAAGAPLDFRLLPPQGDNGHALFAQYLDTWSPIVDSFLREHGFPQLQSPVRPASVGRVESYDALRIPALAVRGGVKGWQQFLAAPEPRAFAFSDDGNWGYAYGDDALSAAVRYCQNRSVRDCRLLAVDHEMVWTPPAGRAAAIKQP